MKYIAIIGLDYRDCKAKKESLPSPENPTKYTLVTKSKHLLKIPFSGVIETENARQNPNYKEIKRKLSGKPQIKEDKKQLKIDFEVKETPIKEKEPTSEPEVEQMPEVPFSEEENLPIDDGEDLSNPDMLEPDMGETPEPENETYEEDNGTLPPDDEPSEIKLDEELDFNSQPEEEVDNENESVSEPEEEVDNENESVSEPEEESKVEEDVPEEISEDKEEINGPITTHPEEKQSEQETIPEDKELEEDVVPETAPEEEEAEIKPVNTPRGWHARNEFIDDAGNIFHKGKYVGKVGADE